jgi:hypothetical protein
LADAICNYVPATRAAGPLTVSEDALALMLRYEGMDQPGSFPGGESGITLGHGDDLGFHTEASFRKVWGYYLSPSQLDRLAKVVGLTSYKAADAAPQFRDIIITPAAADAVFCDYTLGHAGADTAAAFPGVLDMHPAAQGALLSLVDNRGGSMTQPSPDDRREMRTIQSLIASKDYAGIAAAIRSMKRLWAGSDVSGLVARREAEACLVETAIS